MGARSSHGDGATRTVMRAVTFSGRMGAEHAGDRRGRGGGASGRGHVVDCGRPHRVLIE